MLTAGSAKDQLQGVRPLKRAGTIKCRPSYNRNRELKFSSIFRPLAFNEAPNDFGEDVGELLTRRDSTGAEVRTKTGLKRSTSLDCGGLSGRGQAPSRYKPQSNVCERLETYYPIHQGPCITVSSADGTTLCGDLESDNQRNAAAQSLFRALNRRFAEGMRSTLDGHMDKILGIVELEVDTKEIGALNEVEIRNHVYQIRSMEAIIDGEKETKEQRRTRKMKVKETWERLVTKVFGRRR